MASKEQERAAGRTRGGDRDGISILHLHGHLLCWDGDLVRVEDRDMVDDSLDRSPDGGRSGSHPTPHGSCTLTSLSSIDPDITK
jgi:hypothetical protein